MRSLASALLVIAAVCWPVLARAQEASPYTPFTVPPDIKNGELVRARLAAWYRAQAEPRPEGITKVWLLLDVTGKVIRSQLKESSGNARIDSIALYLMTNVVQFTPALNRTTPVTVWVDLPIVVGPRLLAPQRTGTVGRLGKQTRIDDIVEDSRTSSWAPHESRSVSWWPAAAFEPAARAATISK